MDGCSGPEILSRHIMSQHEAGPHGSSHFHLTGAINRERSSLIGCLMLFLVSPN